MKDVVLLESQNYEKKGVGGDLSSPDSMVRLRAGVRSFFQIAHRSGRGPRMFPGTLKGSWLRSGVAEVWTCARMRWLAPQVPALPALPNAGPKKGAFNGNSEALLQLIVNRR